MIQRLKAFVTIDTSKCNLCRLCIELCPTGVFVLTNNGIKINSDVCIACLGCVALCPKSAITVHIDKNSYELVERISYKDTKITNFIRSASHHHNL